MYRSLHYLIVCCCFVSFSIFACEMLLSGCCVITTYSGSLSNALAIPAHSPMVGPYVNCCVHIYCKRLLLFGISLCYFFIANYARFVCCDARSRLCNLCLGFFRLWDIFANNVRILISYDEIVCKCKMYCVFVHSECYVGVAVMFVHMCLSVVGKNTYEFFRCGTSAMVFNKWMTERKTRRNR